MHGGDPDAKDFGPNFNFSKDAIEAEVANLQRAFDNSARELNSMAATLKELKKRDDDITKLTHDRDKVESRLRDLKAGFRRIGRLSIITYGEVPTIPSKDLRLPMAIGMGGVGLYLPLFIATWLAGRGRRVRFPDADAH